MQADRSHRIPGNIFYERFLGIGKILVIREQECLRHDRDRSDIGALLVQHGKRVLHKEALKATIPYIHPGCSFAELTPAGNGKRFFNQGPGTPFIGGERAEFAPPEEHGLWRLWPSEKDKVTVCVPAQVVGEEERCVHAPAEYVHAPGPGEIVQGKIPVRAGKMPDYGKRGHLTAFRKSVSSGAAC